MFEIVDVLRLKGEFEEWRHMPAEIGNVHGQPRKDRMCKQSAQTMKPTPAKDRPGEDSHKAARQTAKQRYCGRSEHEKRRRNRHEDEVLNHVRGEQEIIEGVNG